MIIDLPQKHEGHKAIKFHLMYSVALWKILVN
jgi:hypothetical protein